MVSFYIDVIVYLFCFVVSLYGLSALNFTKFIKQGKVIQTWTLYFVLACCMAYLLGSFIMAISYYFYIN